MPLRTVRGQLRGEIASRMQATTIDTLKTVPPQAFTEAAPKASRKRPIGESERWEVVAIMQCRTGFVLMQRLCARLATLAQPVHSIDSLQATASLELVKHDQPAQQLQLAQVANRCFPQEFRILPSLQLRRFSFISGNRMP